jgi:hypothetical protein
MDVCGPSGIHVKGKSKLHAELFSVLGLFVVQFISYAVSNGYVVFCCSLRHPEKRFCIPVTIFRSGFWRMRRALQFALLCLSVGTGRLPAGVWLHPHAGSPRCMGVWRGWWMLSNSAVSWGVTWQFSAGFICWPGCVLTVQCNSDIYRTSQICLTSSVMNAFWGFKYWAYLITPLIGEEYTFLICQVNFGVNYSRSYYLEVIGGRGLDKKNGGLLWTQQWTFGFHKVHGVAEELLDCQEGLCFMELVIFEVLTAVKRRVQSLP